MRWQRWAVVWALGALWAGGSAAEVGPVKLFPSPTVRGEWTQDRGDLAQSGRCLLPGRIKQPAVAWSLPVGARRTRVAVRPAAGETTLALQSTTLRPTSPPTSDPFAVPPAGLGDLAGDGKLVPLHPATNVKYAHFLPDAKGLQKFVMQDGMAIKNVPTGPHRPVATGSLYRYDHGREELVWTTAPEEQCEGPLCCVADADGDGLPDIFVSTWWRVMVFDGRTGAKKAECKWHNGRNYGHFQLADLNGDGLPEPIVFADFMVHLDVLRNDHGQLHLQWRKEVDFRLFGKRKVVRTLPDVVVRVKGRAPLLVCNVYNDTGDERWHTMLWDGLSGDVVADLPDRFCQGHADLDGSGGRTLCLTQTAGAAVPPAGRLWLARWTGSKFEESLAAERGRWLTATAPYNETVATIAAGGDQAVLVSQVDGAPCAWAVLPADRGQVVQAFAWRDHQPTRAAAVTVPADVTIRAATAGTSDQVFYLDLVGRDWDRQPLALTNLAARQLDLGPAPVRLDPPLIARLAAGERPAVVTAYGATGVAVVDPPSPSAPAAKVRWSRPGRGRSASIGAETEGYVLADLPAGRTVLAATETPTGGAALAGYSPDGRRTFEHLFPVRFPGGEPIWNEGGLTHWLAVPDGGSTAIYASLRRSVMHTDESVLLTPDGRARWWNDNLMDRGCGGKPLAIAARGTGAVLCGQYPDIHFALDAADGKPLALLVWPFKELGGWSGYSHPVLADLPGGPLVITGACHYTLAAWTLDGQLRWHTEYLDGSNLPVALRQGPGGLEIGMAAYRGGFRSYEAATGKLLWSWPRRPTTPIVTGDVDGDGEEEYVFGEGRRLVALGAPGGQPRVKWELELPGTCGPPVLGDVTGDGRSSVALVCGDGRLCVIGPAP